MAIALAHPGVYVEEVPSGVRTISGVSTSITAFVGRTPMGPTLEPTLVSSFSEYERRFGGLSVDREVGHAVRAFFVNGGGSALIVRVFKVPSGETDDPRATFTVGASGTNNLLDFAASSPGAWGRRLRITVTASSTTPDTPAANALGVPVAALFHLTVELLVADAVGAEVVDREVVRNVTVVESARRVDRVLATESRYVRVTTALPVAGHLPPPAGVIAPVANDGFDSDALDQTAYTAAFAALENGAAEFNLLAIPSTGALPGSAHSDAAALCVKRRALYVVDPHTTWDPATGVSSLGIAGTAQRNVAVYFPRVTSADPLANGQVFTSTICGHVAGVIARTDAERGVWKAPAGLDAGLSGVVAPVEHVSDVRSGELNKLGVNGVRALPSAGTVVWGARTGRGADLVADEYKYVPVRRLALYIEESLYRGLQWAVFEPNDEPLWSQLRLNVGSFMNTLFRRGAFQGQSAREAYFVKCDRETTTQDDVNRGVVNVLVGFAPLKPAEFVVVRLQQMAGQSVV